MKNVSHLTAISRKTISVPMRYLSENGLIVGRSLDYGCGRGFDADTLNMSKFDPYYFPTPKIGFHYDTITCNYVLNVIQDWDELLKCVKTIQDLLSQDGTAYITVRRDMTEKYVSKRGTFQALVYLNVRSIKKTSCYEIYAVKKSDNLKIGRK